jgi:arylsulfatase A-like enzyme
MKNSQHHKLALLALAFLTVLCPPRALGDGSPGHPNVVLITIDTLRVDHLSCYGYAWKTSPYIDQLAAQGTRFTRSYTAIPLTGPAHLSLFTSRYPQEHGARRNGLAIAGDRPLPAFPQILRANGFRTAAFVSAWPLTHRLTNLGAWFDHYDENLTRRYQLFNSSRWAEDVTPPAIEWLKQNGRTGKPFFLWIHYFDPHAPYDFRKYFADIPKAGASSPSVIADRGMRERIRNYDTEIAYTDWHLGKVLAAIEELDLTKSTLVVLTADHGESLGEHDYVGHGRHLYENIIQTPLIVRFPGKVKAGHVVRTPVSILDIGPTILELALGDVFIKAKAALSFVGRSLAPVLTTGETLSERRIYNVTFPGKKGSAPGWLSWLWVSDGELPLRFGYVEGSSKLIWSPEDRSLAAYNVTQDPHEAHPKMFSAATRNYKDATKRLTSWFLRTESRAAEKQLSKRDLEVLKSLGYVQ